MEQEHNAFNMISQSFKNNKPPVGIEPIKVWLENRIVKLVQVSNDYLNHDSLRNINHVAEWIDEAILLAGIYQEANNGPEGEPADVIEYIMEKRKGGIQKLTTDKYESYRKPEDDKGDGQRNAVLRLRKI